MPRGNPGIWKEHGTSYAEVYTGQEYKRVPKEVPSVSEIKQLPAAGTLSNHHPVGAGSFVLEASWTLGSATSPVLSTSMAKSQYKPPPPDYKPTLPLRTDRNNVVLGSEPIDFTTSKQLDFRLERVQGVAKPAIAGPRPLAQVLPTGHVPDFSTTTKHEFKGKTRREVLDINTAGGPRSQMPAYNIITGASPLHNNTFEAWDSRDYRRHR